MLYESHLHRAVAHNSQFSEQITYQGVRPTSAPEKGGFRLGKGKIEVVQRTQHILSQASGKAQMFSHCSRCSEPRLLYSETLLALAVPQLRVAND